MGKLVGVPYFKEAYHGKLDKSQWGLVEVAQLCNYKGTIWATWDASAPPFLEYLGDFRLYLDLSLDAWDGREGGIEVLGGIQKWLIPCNWKFPAENFSGDSYHNISHRSVDMVGIGPSGSGRRDMQERLHGPPAASLFPRARPPDGRLRVTERSTDASSVPALARGVGVLPAVRRGAATAPGGVGAVNWEPGGDFPEHRPASAPAAHHRRLASARAASDRSVALVSGRPARLRQRCEDFLRQYYIRYSGPGGLTEQDDMENWNYAHAASRGTIARRYPYSYEQGMGYEVQDFAWEGLQLPGSGDGYYRGEVQ